MKWKAYPRYWYPDQAWLDQLPLHWRLKRIKHTTYVKGRIGWKGLRSDEFTDEGPYLVTGTDFVQGRVNWDSCYHVSEQRYEEDPYIQLREGDLLITKDGTIGKVAVVEDLPGKASLNSGIFVTRSITNDYITEYLYWVLNSGVFAAFIDYNKAGSTISHLYQNVFVEFVFPVPSVREQRAIAAFLDRETRRIDALIAKKQRQIELLQEKRAALISHAVTKGLDPDAPMKDSGIEWLREIPAHWSVVRIGYFARVLNGSTPSRSRPDYWTDGTIPWLSSGKVNDDVITEPSEWITEAALHESSLEVVPSGSAVIGLVGQGRTRGMAAFMGIDAAINQNMAAIIPGPQLRGRFIQYMLEHMYSPIRESGRGANQAALNCEIVADLRLPLPPVSEQEGILACLDAQSKRISHISTRIEDHIATLQEYRTALISAAVTGKIDVREPTADHLNAAILDTEFRAGA